ncbi:MAG: hypothetical protein V3U96_12605 [Paracoccaceae bacterium]
MASTKNTSTTRTPSGYRLIRVVIASYFVMVSTGFVSGTNAIPLADTVMPHGLATLVGSSALFILGVLVLTGVWLRPAVLVLAAIILSSATIQNFGSTATAIPGDFWRELTLISTLLLTTMRSPNTFLGSLFGGSLFGFSGNDDTVSPRRVALVRPSKATRLPVAPTHPPLFNRVNNIFLDDSADSLAT